MPKLLLYVAKLIILYSSKNCLQCKYPYGKMTKDKSSWGGFAMSTSQKGDLCQRMVVAHTCTWYRHLYTTWAKGVATPPAGHPPAARPILSFLRGDLTPIGKLYIKKNAVLHEFYHTPSPPKIDPMHMYGTISQF
jgi:hypothetical protein